LIYRFFAHSGPEREKTPAGILKETKMPGEFDRGMGGPVYLATYAGL
jgi:hypothetical protein